MKTRSLLFLLAAVLVTALLAGCSGQAGTDLEGAERDQVLAYAEPLADNLLAGLNSGDYATFSRDFNDKMKEAIDETKFQALKRQLGDQIGAYQSRAVDKVTDYGKVVTIAYKGVFEKTDKMQILFTLEKDEPHKVTGLYFR